MLSGHYRIIYPAQALQAAGYDVDIAKPGEDDFKFMQMHNPDGSIEVVSMDPSVFPDADVAVIQRPLFDTTWQFIRCFQERGIRVVVDVDDDFDHLHPNNPAAQAIRRRHPRLSPKNVHRAIAQADALVVSTPELAIVYGRSAREVHVVENRVPSWWLDIRKQESELIGWSGTTRYHIGDVEQMGPTLGRLQDLGRDVHVIGPEPEQVRFGLRRPATFSGWVPLDEYGTHMAGIGVGVVPLQPSQFNRSKSWLKGIEFAAVEVPVIASPSPEYQRLYGLGLCAGLAEKPRDWFRLLSDLRPEHGAHLRDRVRSLGFTYDDRVADWWSAWTGSPSATMSAI